MYFTIWKNAGGKFWSRAVGDNNEIMAQSELMNSKASCEHAISVVRSEAGSAKTYDKTNEISSR